jgi:pentatricopeptide repeat protein
MARASTKRSLLASCLFLMQIKAFHVQRNRIFTPTSASAKQLPERRTISTSLLMVMKSAQSRPEMLSQLESEIVALGRRGATDEAIRLYESIEKPNIRILNSAIDACARARPTRLDLAFELLDQGIAQKGLHPNVFTFGSIMSACNRARRSDLAVQVLRTMEVSLCSATLFVSITTCTFLTSLFCFSRMNTV